MGAVAEVTAILAAHNEGDVIAQVIAHLVGQGVRVYLMDHGSTDDTVEQAEPFLGRGLIAIERFAGDPAHPWRSVLRRKEELARQLAGDWFLHHDADEIRESPWASVTLAAALARVDAGGYNAVDFKVFNFPPVGDDWERGRDLAAAFPGYEPAEAYDRVQIKAWKKTDVLDLVSSGGHEAVFPGRRVFPLRFILRHYPIRGQAHGERKVFAERRPRLVAAERDSEGWHRQYDGLEPGHRFVRDPAGLTPYDPDEARFQLTLEHRGTAATAADDELVSCRRTLDLVGRELDGKNREAERLHRELDAANHEIEDLRRDLEARRREAETWRQEAEALRHRLAEVLASRSWRWTAPLRALLRRRG